MPKNMPSSRAIRHPEEFDPDEDAVESSQPPSNPSGDIQEKNPSGSHQQATSDDFPDVSYGPHWSAKRHLTCGNSNPARVNLATAASWRLKDKLRTAHAALVVCLNIDVDPPDVVKTNPSATLECWVNPHSVPTNKALEAIGSNLKHQFEGLSNRCKFRPYLDPSYEETRRFCQYLRRMARDERCLFYYNGHGVPKPTPSGELWVFNKTYSQYIPVSLAEIQNWLQSPCIYVWDCSAAGNLLTNFNSFAERRDHEMNTLRGGYPEGFQPFSESLQLAACLAHEQLPMCPELPADLFTSCLTSPIDIALRWHVMNNKLPDEITFEMVQMLPGDLRDRRTPLGELNWIFTAVTDTIAWSTFPREIFTKLYRSDLLVASLFRNFLLAERIMKDYRCTPHTQPPLPATNTHPLWVSWDLAVEDCLRQLPALLQQDYRYVYVSNRFFSDHLTALDVWLSRGGSALTRRGPGSVYSAVGFENMPDKQVNSSAGHGLEHLIPRKPPDQLPIVLQVLLSQQHRLRALILLSQFVDLGPWAVHLALTIGIFPYISKLLQAPAGELRPVLIFIWARILAVDSTCQVDLVNNQGYRYFAEVLNQAPPENTSIPNSPEHRAMCCFILSAMCRGYRLGQKHCWDAGVFLKCYDRLDDQDFLSRQWTALCIGQMWDGNDDGRIYGVDRGAQDKLISMLKDDSPEVRCAVLFALGTFMGASGSADPLKRGGGGTGSMYHLDERTHFRLEVAVATGAALTTKEDISPMVRKELLILLSCLVKDWRGFFVVVAWLYWQEEQGRLTGRRPDDDIANQTVLDWLDGFGDDETYREENKVLLSSFYTLYVCLLELSVDPYPEVQAYARTIVDYIMALLLDSPFFKLEGNALSRLPSSDRASIVSESSSKIMSLHSSLLLSSPRSSTTESSINGALSGSASLLRRTASFANSLKSIAGSYAFPSISSDDNSPTTPTTQKNRTDILEPPSPNMNFAKYISPYPGVSGVSNQTPVTPSQRRTVEADYSSSDVMEALIEEDMERLRARRRKKTQTRQFQSFAHPEGSRSIPSSHDLSAVPLGLGTGTGIPDYLPLKSQFYDWCCEYFTETQMKQPESEEPGSLQYNEQMWRRQRNEKVLTETQAQADHAAFCPWERHVATLQHGGHPLKLAFHGYDPHLFVSNESSSISVYDWTARKRILTFNNNNEPGTIITSLHCINQEVGGIIMAGSSDGIARLYRNYDPRADLPIQLVTSFRALNSLIPMKRGSGLVLEWQQGPGIILAGGDSKIIRAWDAHRETSVVDIDTGSGSPVTSLSCDSESSTFVASFADGTVKIIDRRLDEEDAVVQTYREHSTWVQSARWQRGSRREVLTASLDGDVKLWDIRGGSSSLDGWKMFPEGLSAFDMHDQCGIYAGSSALTSSRWRQQTTIIRALYPDRRTKELSRASLYTGLHSAPPRVPTYPCVPTASSLSFHPNEMILGIGTPDGTIKLLGCKFIDRPEIHQLRNDSHPIPSNGTRSRQLVSP